MNANTAFFRIGGQGFCLSLPDSVTPNKPFEPFAVGRLQPDIHISFEPIDTVDSIAGALSHECCDFSVFTDFESWNDTRVCCDGEHREIPYTFAQRAEGFGNWRVRYLSSYKDKLNDWRHCFGAIPLEAVLLDFNRLILHACYVSSEHGGILFSGPSGIGKSTQGDLWESLQGARVINGDRPIIGKCNGVWNAYGSPYAGSSQRYVNENDPIRAIVMLSQAPECSIRRLSPAEAFRRLYAQTVINSWNQPFVLRACELLTDLATQVPVYHLACTPDKHAVSTLKTELNRSV